jgi:hypothetical protein
MDLETWQRSVKNEDKFSNVAKERRKSWMDLKMWQPSRKNVDVFLFTRHRNAEQEATVRAAYCRLKSTAVTRPSVTAAARRR